MLMAAGTRRFQFEGKDYLLLVGILIDENFIGNIRALTSLEIRLYYNRGSDFLEYYSFSSGTQQERRLPDELRVSLAAGKPYIYDRGAEEGEFLGVYTPLFDAEHRLIAVVFCGLRSATSLVGWLTRTNLFIGIFVVGALLSVLAGLVVSRRLTRPLVTLSAGVGAVSRGDFRQSVAVHGHDEVAQLSSAFNLMARQLSDLRDIEAKLRRRERLSTLGEVAAGIAHEVRNPLGIIKTTAELLQQSPNLTAIEARRLGYVVDEVRRIDRLIHDFLAFAKPPQRMVPINVADLIKSVLAFCQQETERRGVSLKLDDRVPGAVVLADPDQLRDACLNLVLNALQAMDRGGVLAIRIFTKNAELTIAFTDTGPGVPAELAGRIFDPFVTSKPAGTGLGLAKVFAIMVSHGGRVAWSNNARGGATFMLILPMHGNNRHDAYDPDGG
jgi:signal transduction histidine kinase